MLIFAGLGNPGAKYANNRHNVGFMAADAIARRHSFSPWTKKFQGEIAEGRLGGEKILLLKPSTFMNLSGQSVGEAMRFYKLEPSAVTVLYDEIDLAAGKVRIKIGGSAGGHNGIRSIDQHIANDYRRVRIGVGHPGAKELVHGYVLGDFSKADQNWLDPLLQSIADSADMLAKGEDNGFMNKISLAVGSNVGAPKPEKAAQSHIRQARPQKPQVKLPETGPMAAMLKKLLGKD
ncbi:MULTISPECIES: aminoacyl-tRNA hydrolase [Mesorhizobium]|uniref:Peptidyl-tRNA hydrolase n=1 Tax=Mesorhizobium denitrificans TaxID=2294114 RepID=A0A371XE41_9HYPH|nr:MULTISPECIES: aminoacyl-tRNA hydrolase [Mesorhizobium]RFC67497.1 aminoacyl-tRNA hydrolase [Mesorhizobium denitrificans]